MSSTGAVTRPLAAGLEPTAGSHIVTPRRGYTHHGIYVGRGKVVQYGGLSRALHRGPVEEVDLIQFARGRPIWIRIYERHPLDREEICRRARSRLGEDRYHLLTNNCEHFCEWCVRGEHCSYQVDELVSHPRRALKRSVDFVANALRWHKGFYPGIYPVANHAAARVSELNRRPARPSVGSGSSEPDPSNLSSLQTGVTL